MELLLLWVWASDKDGSLQRYTGPIQLGEHIAADPEHAGGTVYHIWERLGNPQGELEDVAGENIVWYYRYTDLVKHWKMDG